MTEGKKKMNETLDWLIHIAVAVVVGVLIVTFVAQRTVVHQISMQPVLYEGDNIIVEKISPKLSTLHKGDIIVFNPPDENIQLIKRLIAVGGDNVEIKNGKVYVNGVADDKFNPEGVVTLPEGSMEYSNIHIPEGYVYALGDNRQESLDCRNFGPIKTSRITGRAIFRFYPFNKFGKI